MVARDGWEAGRRVGVVIKGQHEGSLGGETTDCGAGYMNLHR